MHKFTVDYRIKGRRMQRRALSSDVAALSKALEWAPAQLALRLKAEEIIPGDVPASDVLEIVAVREGWTTDYPTGSEDGMSFICNRWTFTGPQGYRVKQHTDGTFHVVSYTASSDYRVAGDMGLSEADAHALAARLAMPHNYGK